MGCNLGLIFLGICIVIAAFIFAAPATILGLVTALVQALIAIIFWVVIAFIVMIIGIVLIVFFATRTI